MGASNSLCDSLHMGALGLYRNQLMPRGTANPLNTAHRLVVGLYIAKQQRNKVGNRLILKTDIRMVLNQYW